MRDRLLQWVGRCFGALCRSTFVLGPHIEIAFGDSFGQTGATAVIREVDPEAIFAIVRSASTVQWVVTGIAYTPWSQKERAQFVARLMDETEQVALFDDRSPSTRRVLASLGRSRLNIVSEPLYDAHDDRRPKKQSER